MPASPAHSAPPKGSGLRLRVLASVLLAPPVLLAVYLGSPYLEPLMAISAAIMAYEWSGLCRDGSSALPKVILILAVLSPLAVLVILAQPLAAWGVLLLLSLAAGASAVRRKGEPLLVFTGAFYIGAAVLAFLWLRGQVPDGRFLALWLFAVVWAADSGAYLFGRTIGGPKLAPRISPKKTWAGFLGAIISAAAASALITLLFSGWSLFVLLLGAAVIAAVEQIGDLLVSKMKRHSGAKDTGALIPGHGGFLDRVDGLLLASIAAALFLYLAGAGDLHG